MSPLRSVVIAAVAVLCATSASAAPTRQALDAAAEALFLDFGEDGVVASPDEVRGRYQQACDLGYEPACRSDRWHDADGLPSLEQAQDILAKNCGRQDPVACVVAGWAIEAEPIPEDLALEDRRARQLDLLKRASDKYYTGCQSSHWSACLTYGDYSLDRYELGVDDDSVLKRHQRGAQEMYRYYCNRGDQRACVAHASMMDQAPELLDKRGSAGNLYRRACDQGYTPGCYQLGLLTTPMKSVTENRHWFDGLCDRGHTASCEWVARSYDSGESLDEESLSAWKRACMLHSVDGCRVAGPPLEAERPAEAMQVHRMGCALGDGVACGRYGLMRHAEGDVSAAVTYLDRGCEAGHVQACVQVGLLRKGGSDGSDVVQRDPNRARKDLMAGCPVEGERNPMACKALGQIFQEGMGAERDRAKAARFYRLACEDDDLEACFEVGESVMGLDRVTRQREDKDYLQWAVDGYTKACDAGYEEACLPAAELLATSPRVADPDEARRRFEALVDEGDAIAARKYGMWLERHASSGKDLSRARDVYERGRDLGDSESTRLLGLLLHEGVGGARKRGKARRLFREACRDGNALACGGANTQIVRP